METALVIDPSGEAPSLEDQHKSAVAETLKTLRNDIADIRSKLLTLAEYRHPVLGPELTLCRRLAEDLRMRLGATEALARDLDPWNNQVK